MERVDFLLVEDTFDGLVTEKYNYHILVDVSFQIDNCNILQIKTNHSQ